MLRPYQQAAHDAVIDWIKKSRESCVIDAATACGKSHIIAELAKSIHSISGGKRVLCLAPSAELVTQNREKYIATGNPASIFSASLGRKSLRHNIVFGTPGTVLNSIERFKGEFAAVIVDECHKINQTIRQIIDRITAHNKNLRVIGLTATPYRLGEGYIYKMDMDGNPSRDNTAKAYFHKLVYRITAKELIESGYLTPPVVGGTKEHYDTIKLKVNKLGKFDQSEIDTAYKGKGRKTAKIINDVIGHAAGHTGVMIFAATIEHANECLESLPSEISAIVTGETPKTERALILKKFKKQEIKYIVNRDVLTTGFDATHVSLIAILRATESASLLQQIIGRGLRLHPDKTHCLVLDYAQNIERHCPDGDIFNPQIDEGLNSDEKKDSIACYCPECSSKNTFLARPNPDGYGLGRDGYFTDLSGSNLDIPSHYGRRCQAWHRGIQCGYRWLGKECEKCGHYNDIAARFCEKCRHEIIDPNDKLHLEKNIETTVLDWKITKGVSKAGNNYIKIMYILSDGKVIPIWYTITDNYINKRAIKLLYDATNKLAKPPLAITYMKNYKSGFYEVINYKKVVDSI